MHTWISREAVSGHPRVRPGFDPGVVCTKVENEKGRPEGRPRNASVHAALSPAPGPGSLRRADAWRDGVPTGYGSDAARSASSDTELMSDSHARVTAKKSPARHGASLERSPNFRSILSLRPGCGVAAHCWNGGHRWWGEVIYLDSRPSATR